MKRLLLIIALCLPSSAQLWSPILSPTSGGGACTLTASGTYAGCAVDWSIAGTGGIPVGTQVGSTVTATGSDQTAAISSLLNASNCGGSAGNQKFVQLAAGTFVINGHLTFSNYCTLKGMGADQTILDCHATSGACVQISGTAPSSASAVAITSGATAGSLSLTLSNASGISAGDLMVVNELNYNPIVNLSGDTGGGACTFCGAVFGLDTNNGESRARAQIVEVASAPVGNVVTISNPLLTDYTHTPPSWVASTVYNYYSVITAGTHVYIQTAHVGSTQNCTSGSSGPPAFSTSGGSVTSGTCSFLDHGVGTTTLPLAIPFTPKKSAGVQDLQVKANLSGLDQNILVSACSKCFVKGVEDNFSDGDHVDVDYDYRSEIRDSYFSNSNHHTSGTHDSAVVSEFASTLTLFENNILERLHLSTIVRVSPAAIVFGYNYEISNFDEFAVNFMSAGHDAHAAHSQFILFEGNVTSAIYQDSTWGSHSHGTNFRNWATGVNLICSPVSNSHSTVVCSPLGFPQQAAHNSYYSYQAARAESFNYPALWFNTVGNVVGSAQQQAAVNTTNSALTHTAVINQPSTRGYDSVTYNRNSGYANSNDDGTFGSDSTQAATTLLVHGDYTNSDSTITWQTGITHTLPASFYLSSQPAWWCSGCSWPSIGPDVTGGTGPGGHVANITKANAAQNCYLNVMGGVDGSAGSPLTFNAAACYTGSTPTVATPTFSPVAGTYSATQSVVITTSTSGATLCYTTDGSAPTANGAGTCTHGTTYTTPVSVSSSLTLQAVGSKSGSSDSGVGSAVYTILPLVATPTFSPVGGTYFVVQSITISSTTGGATLCYTADGSTPTANGSGTCTHGTTYSTSVPVSISQTLKAIGSISGGTDSGVGSATYMINLSIPAPAAVFMTSNRGIQ